MLLSIAGSRTVCGAALAMLLASAAAGQGSPEPPAPVPPQVLAAKRVFISNAGVNGDAVKNLRSAGDVNLAYDAFYGALKAWGRYELVTGPAGADVVFEIRYLSPDIPFTRLKPNEGDYFTPNLVLRIVDGRTHFLLWTIVEPVEPAFRKSNWARNIRSGVGSLVAELKSLK